MREDSVFLNDILDAINQIEEYIADIPMMNFWIIG